MTNFRRDERTAGQRDPVSLSPDRVTGGPRAPAQQAIKLELVRSLRMHRSLALGVAALVFVMVVAFALTRKPVYRAESLVYVEPLSTKLLSDGTAGTYDPSRYDSYLQQQLQTVERRDILAVAIAQLPQGTWKFPGETEESAVTRLQNALKVERVQNSYQLEISLTASDPAAAAAVVNAVVKAYLDQGRKEDHARADQKLQLLTEERQRIQTELAQDKAEQATLSASLGVANPAGEMGNQYDMQLAGVRSQLVAAREAHDVAAAQLSSVTAAGGLKTPGLVASAEDLIASDAGLSSMKATISQRRAVLSSQMAGLTPGNPVYKQDQEEIAGLDRTLDKMTGQLRDQAERRLQDKLRLELQRTGDVEARLNSQLARQTATATGAAPRLQRATELAADMQRLSARYASVDDAIRGIELETGGPGAAHLALAADVPSSPEPSKQKLLLLLALPLALLVGGLAAVIARKRDPHVYTGLDMEEILGFQPMGALPASHEVSSAVMEEFALRLAAGLQSAYRSGSARSYVFTPASPAIDVHGFVYMVQGKLVQLGFTAEVIDAATLLKPIRKADAELSQSLGGDGFAAAHIEQLKQTSDLVLIDAPTLLHSAITEYAVRCADATVLIVEAGVTTREELDHSTALLQRLHAPGVAAVLLGLRKKYAGPEFETRIAGIERQQEYAGATPGRRTAHAEEATEAPYVPPVSGSYERAVAEAATATTPSLDPPAEIRVDESRPALIKGPLASFVPAHDDTVKRETPATPWLRRLFTMRSEPVLRIVPDEDEDEIYQDHSTAAVVVPTFVPEPAPVARTPETPVVRDPMPVPVALVMPPAAEVTADILFCEKPAAVVPILSPSPVMEASLSSVPEAVPATAINDLATDVLAPAMLFGEEETLTEPALPTVAASVFGQPTVSVSQAPAIETISAAAVPVAPPVLPPAVTPIVSSPVETVRASISRPSSTRLVPPSRRVEVDPVAARSRRTWTPVAVTSIPSVVTSIARPRPPGTEPASVPLQMPVSEMRERLASIKPVMHEGPARASEGLEATKQASAERKAAKAVEPGRGLLVPSSEWGGRAKTASLPADAHVQQAPLTRRWGALSRFERISTAPQEEYGQATGTLGDR